MLSQVTTVTSLTTPGDHCDHQSVESKLVGPRFGTGRVAKAQELAI